MKTIQWPSVYPMAVLFLCGLSVSACNAHKKPSWAEDKGSVNEAIKTLEGEQKKAVESTETSLMAMESRLRILESTVEDQHTQIESLTAKVEEHERIEEQRRIEAQKLLEKQKRLAERKRIEERKRLAELKRIEAERRQRGLALAKGAEAQPSAEAGSVERQTNSLTDAPAGEDAAKAAAGAVEENEKNTYTAAYLAYKSGRLDEAAKGFNKQLDLYPKGEYVDQAWYWLGETRYAQHGYTLAMNAFKHIADHYPESGKHAAALLKLGQILQALEHDREAKKYYAKLIDDHPDSEAAEQARAALTAYEKREAAKKERQQ